jgi:CO dehydrogenase maturation factor
MRIAFVGKGGSGKTTLSALFSRYIAAKHLPIVAIDADINQHLAMTLGLDSSSPLPPLGIEMERIKDYLRGSNPLISSSEEMVKTTPPGHGSRLLKIKEKNAVYDYFERTVDRVRVMAVGHFTGEDLGVNCYHSKTGAVELILNHLIDGKKEYVVVDMTAGADSFASGMFTKFDVTFLVVEPTLKSVNVYQQYKDYANEYGVTVKVIANKIEQKDDVAFIKKFVGNDLAASLPKSQYVRSIEKGDILPLDNLEAEVSLALNSLLDVVDAQPKDWQRFYDQTVHFHVKNAKGWANAAVGTDLTKQIDPSFDFVAATQV